MALSALRAAPLVLAAMALIAAAEPASLRDCAGIGDPAQRLACYDALAARAPVAPPAPPAAPPATTPVEQFGKPPEPKPVEPDQISSTLLGAFDGWRPGSEFHLQNGQVWEAVGGDKGFYPGIPDNPQVTISRSFFGAYWLQVEGMSRRIKVKRIR